MSRVLVSTEYSNLSTGYAIYGKELLKRLHATPGIEVAELAISCHQDDERIYSIPWRVYPVVPPKRDHKAVEQFYANPYNVYGGSAFHPTLLDFKPTHVIDFRDCWHFEHQFRSPLRQFFAHLIMPAIDAVPQHKSWINMYAQADMVLGYTEWGLDVLRKAGLNNTLRAASPCANSNFFPMKAEEKSNLKKSLGLGNISIVGTVMRNQRRKLFPNLFVDFKKFLDESKRTDIYLLCHTSYPDTWELDELIIDSGISNRVLFTYLCRNPQCQNVEVSFYSGVTMGCSKCRQYSSSLPNTKDGLNEPTLNVIYNMMDVYVQYATNEGYGIPLAEALACGLPVMAVDYSAMSEIVKQARGRAIGVKTLFKEAETGRDFALPCPDSFTKHLLDFFCLSEEQKQKEANISRYSYGMRSWDDVAAVWLEAIANTKPKLAWNSPRRNLNAPQNIPQNLSNSDFAKFLIKELLHEPEKVGTYLEARLTRDLNNGFALRGVNGSYINEDIGLSQARMDWNRDIALNHLGNYLREKQELENARLASL